MNLFRMFRKTKEQKAITFIKREGIHVDSSAEELRNHVARVMCVRYSWRDWAKVNRVFNSVDWQVVWKELQK